MASQITLAVEPRGKPIKKLPKTITVNLDTNGEELHNSIAKASGASVHRLRITKGSDRSVVPNDKGTTIDDTGLRESSVIHVKDLGMSKCPPDMDLKDLPRHRAKLTSNFQPGPQIAWRTVFIIEYLGPLLIPALFLYPLRSLLYFNFETIPAPSNTQILVCALLTLHFLKREYETIFVHRFSNATMPARNIFKNSAHYWALSGFNIAYWVFRPDAGAATRTPNTALVYAGLALFIFSEVANLNAHIILRDLRRPGTTERGIPSGFGFSWVTCPNYCFEILAWIGVYLVSQLSWSVLLFTVVSGLQMWSWGWKKEKRYRKEFGDKYKKKKTVILPFLC
ncbi:Steroid alpha reductase family protein [Penicillium maclennaniae]|uniref:Steroid alpha reductase family protein n=1 Tax=Penicillium maclennaniae TaxID=1343394 RepID=UPI002541DBCD|nr:Steroid alpha reductase family protein [Penicillium maclennaniae]KAJ5669995.1 Steroid alpha reductase family protein [Penicillium maclennaniae]